MTSGLKLLRDLRTVPPNTDEQTWQYYWTLKGIYLKISFLG